jgi:hypothetical protein
MEVIVAGYKALDFVSDKGDRVVGTKLFVAFPEEGVVGQMVDSYFVRPAIKLPELKPNAKLDLAFDRRGKLISVVLA